MDNAYIIISHLQARLHKLAFEWLSDDHSASNVFTVETRINNFICTLNLIGLITDAEHQKLVTEFFDFLRNVMKGGE